MKKSLALALALILLSGCNSQPIQPDPSTAPEPVPADPPSVQVQVDWSKLEQSKGDAAHPDYDAGRWYDATVTNLIPCEDYGPLYPYVGSLAQNMVPWMEGGYPSPVYGLMTREGKVVTDPVYQGVNQPTYRHGDQIKAHPVLVLSKADENWNTPEITNGQRYAVAALDGSWCTEFEFWSYAINDESLFLVGPAGTTWLNPNSGERLDWSWSALGLGEEDIISLLEDLMWVYGFRWLDDGVFLGLTNTDNWEHAQARLFHPEDGSITLISRQEWESLLDADLRSDWNTRDEWNFMLEEGQITLTRGNESYRISAPDGMSMLHSVEVNHGLVILHDYSGAKSGTWLFRLDTSAMLAHANYIGFIQDAYNPDTPNFVHVMYENGSQALFGPNFTPFLSYPAPSPEAQAFFIYRDGLISARDDATFFGCYNAENGSCIFYRNLTLGD